MVFPSQLTDPSTKKKQGEEMNSNEKFLSQYFENNAIRYNFETARTSNFGKALV